MQTFRPMFGGVLQKDKRAEDYLHVCEVAVVGAVSGTAEPDTQNFGSFENQP